MESDQLVHYYLALPGLIEDTRVLKSAGHDALNDVWVVKSIDLLKQSIRILDGIGNSEFASDIGVIKDSDLYLFPGDEQVLELRHFVLVSAAMQGLMEAVLRIIREAVHAKN